MKNAPMTPMDKLLQLNFMSQPDVWSKLFSHSGSVTLFFFSGQGESSAVEEHALQPQHFRPRPLLLPSVSFSCRPCWQPWASDPVFALAWTQCRCGRPGEGGVQSGLWWSHGLVSASDFLFKPPMLLCLLQQNSEILGFFSSVHLEWWTKRRRV